MISIALTLLIAMTFFWSYRSFGLASFVTMGVIGFSVYSIPAVLGLVYPFQLQLGSRDTALVPMASKAQLITAFAWFFFLVTLAIVSSTRRSPPVIWSGAKQIDRALVLSFLCLSIAGYVWISLTEGPLFFLQDRYDQSASFIKLLWRWVNAFGFLAAVVAGTRNYAAIFLVFLVMYFLAGDRTVITITAVCYFVVMRPWAKRSGEFRPFYSAMLLVAVLSIVILGKPIYLAVKAQSLEPLVGRLIGSGIEVHLKAFEPFSTANLLNLTATSEFRISFSDLFLNLLAQILIVPSFFGIDTNAFNTKFTEAFSLYLSWGVAGNYLAQAYAVGGLLGVAAYSILLCSVLIWCDRNCSRRGVMKLLIAFIGALFAVYVHRNSLDNMLSFVRQFVIIAILSGGLAAIVRSLILVRHKYPQNSFNSRR